MIGKMRPMASIEADAIAGAVIYAISQPENIGVNEISIRPLQKAI